MTFRHHGLKRSDLQQPELAVRILRGEKPGRIPVGGVEETKLYVNAATAEKLGVPIPADVLAQADEVVR